MANSFPPSRVFGLLAAIFSVFALFVAVTSAQMLLRQSPSRLPGVLVLDEAADAGTRQFPPVMFDHDKHRRMATANWSSCGQCHRTPKIFMPVEGVSPGKRMDAWHGGCVTCHTAEQRAGRPAGPSLASCRACHNGSAPPPIARNMLEASNP